MTTQPHATLNLRSVGVKAWLNKNEISIDTQNTSHPNKRLPPELQPKSRDSHSSDTKQTIVPPFFSHSRSRTGSQGSFVTNHTDIDTSITYEVIASNSRNNHHHFQAIKKYKKIPAAALRKNCNPKYRMSMSRDSTKIQSLQLVTPRSCSNTPSRESRDRALCGSLIEQSRRRSHTLKHHNNDNHHTSSHVRPSSKSNAKTPQTLDPIIQNSDIDDTELESIKTKSKLTNNIKLTTNNNNTQRKKRMSKSNRKRSGSSLLSSSTKTSKSTHKSYKSKQSKSTILTKKSKQKQFDPSSFRLEEWLSSMDILKYKEIFDRDGFDKLGAIVELNSDDLREMNIPKGHCKMILRQVHNLQNELDIKPLQSMHCRHRSNPDTTKRATRKHSSHSTQSHSDPVIPPIDVILAFEDENDAFSNYESCDFPDIDASKIDLNKVHGHKHIKHSNKVHDDKDTVSSIVDTETAEYHTFPRTSTIGSILPPNNDMRHNKTPQTNAALQSLRVAIPQPLLAPAAAHAKPQTSDTSTSSLPSFHPTNLHEDEEKISPKVMHTNNENNYSDYNMLPQYYRYQLPQQAQRYMVYHPQQNIVYEAPDAAVHYDDDLNINKRYAYRHRRYDYHNTKRRNNQYFISDEHKESHPRRHSISSTASNDYVLYQKAAGYDCDEDYKSGLHQKDEYHSNENKNESKKKKKWHPSRVYKRKKHKSKSKPKHKQSNSGPLIALTSQKLLKTNSETNDKSKDVEQCNRMPWFLCGSSKNTHKQKPASVHTINTDSIDTTQQQSTHLDLSQTQTRKSAKSKSKTKTKSKKHTIIVSTPHEHSYTHTNSKSVMLHNMMIHHAAAAESGTITPYSSCHNRSGSSYESYYNKTPEFIPRPMYTNDPLKSKSDAVDELDTKPNKKQGNINMSVSLDELDRAKALNEAKELHRIGNLQCAAEKYAQFLHYFRNDIDARIRYSLCLLDLGEYELCKAQLDALIECGNSNNCMLQFVYGLLQHKLENYSEALQHYNAALVTGYVYQDRIYNNLASLFRACKDYEKAEKYQIMALNIDSRNYVAYLNYAKILCDIHRYDDAIKQYQNAISLRPDLVDLRVEFALFLMDIKEDYLLAATELNTAHKLAPENSEVDDLLKQAIEYCGEDDDDLDDLDDVDDIEAIGDDNSDTLVLLSPEQSTKEEEDDEDERELFSVMEQLQLNEDNSGINTHKRRRKESLPINLPKPPIAASKASHSDSRSSAAGYTPIKLAPREKSSSKSTRKSICGALPPPHNPLNPNDPLRRNSLLNMNRSQLSHYLRVDADDDCDADDAVSVFSDLSMLSDEQQI